MTKFHRFLNQTCTGERVKREKSSIKKTKRAQNKTAVCKQWPTFMLRYQIIVSKFFYHFYHQQFFSVLFVVLSHARLVFKIIKIYFYANLINIIHLVTIVISDDLATICGYCYHQYCFMITSNLFLFSGTFTTLIPVFFPIFCCVIATTVTEATNGAWTYYDVTFIGTMTLKGIVWADTLMCCHFCTCGWRWCPFRTAYAPTQSFLSAA